MQPISIFNKTICLLLCVIDIYIKYAWAVPWNDIEGTTITNALQKVLDKFNHRPNKICPKKCSEFYNRSMKSCVQDNDIEIYSTHKHLT